MIFLQTTWSHIKIYIYNPGGSVFYVADSPSSGVELLLGGCFEGEGGGGWGGGMVS